MHRQRTCAGIGCLLVAVMVLGCAKPFDRADWVVTAPPRAAVIERSSEAQLLYPLQVGNHWSYARTFSIDLCEACSPSIFSSTVDVDLIGTEPRFGREYVVQRETYRDQTQVIVWNFLYRQDQGGLYNADPEPSSIRGQAMVDAILAVVGTPAMKRGVTRSYELDPESVASALRRHERVRELVRRGIDPEAARPGPLGGEIALLLYPLRTGLTWNVREDPRIVYTVEGHEVLSLPAGRLDGWRIRIDWSDVFGSEDRAHVWYGKAGFLALRTHIVSEGRDDQGNPTGSVVSEQTELLTDFQLVD